MEIDKIKRVVSDKASGEEREEVRAWMEGAEERKCFLENAKAYYREEIASDRMGKPVIETDTTAYTVVLE